MTDFVSDGQPFETPIAAATEGYAATPPSFGAGFAAMFHESSTVEPISRWLQRSVYDTSGSLSGAAARWFRSGTLAEQFPEDAAAALTPTPTPMLSAEDANARYAPTGPDGKPVPITDAPMPEGVAQLVGQAKADQIERDGVLSRFSAANYGAVTFGSNVAAFMLDPLNAATALMPSVGEEAILGQLGRAGLTGFAARAIARGAGGAIGGAAAQAPLTAIRYGLGTEEASDYDLREAMRDVMLSAAGGAIAQAGFGALGDWLRYRRPAGAGAAEALPAPSTEAPLPSAAATVALADPMTKADAMRAAVSQVMDGRQVDVEPVFAAAVPRGPKRPEDLLQFLASNGGVEDFQGELRALGADREVVPFRGRLVKAGGLTLDYAREAAEEAGYLQPDSTIRDFLDAVDQNLRGRAVWSDADESAARDWEAWRDDARHGPSEPYDPLDPNDMFADLGDEQHQLYEHGYAASIPQDEFDEEREAIYGENAGAARAPMAPPTEAATDTDRAIAEAERQLGAGGAPLHPEDAAEIARAGAGLEDASAQGAAYQEAGACLAGGAA